MLAQIRQYASEQLSRFWRSAKLALLASYGWKPPLEAIPGGYASPVLYLLTAVFCLARIFWPLQFLKLLVRMHRGSGPSIHPAWAEAYLLGSIGLAAVATWSAASETRIVTLNGVFIAAALVWKVGDTVTNNLYYLLLRPVLDQTPPHNTYRSLVLALLGVAEVWAWLSLGWYYIGATAKPFENVLAAFYFTTQFFFTGGDAGYSPVGPSGHWLSILTTVSAVSMMVVVLGRAIGILRPPPSSHRPDADLEGRTK